MQVGFTAGVAAGALLWHMFPAPVEGLWPPGPEERRIAVDVVYWDWHTIIVVDEGDGWAEYEYVERRWHLDGERGVSGVLRSLLWPSGSAVAAERSDRPYWERHPARAIKRWSFVVGERGLDAMRKRLDAEIGEPIPGWRGWHTGVRSYQLFYRCHHFTAGALREAGLPIRP